MDSAENTVQTDIGGYARAAVRPLALVLVLAALSTGSSAQVIQLQEAERCVIRWAKPSSRFEKTPFASGGACVIDWGHRKGDSLTWNWDLKVPLKRAVIALRYAYDQANMTAREGPQDRARQLMLCVDGRTTIPLHVPNTGGWGDFETAYGALPDLEAGAHTVVLTAPVDRIVTNLDCFTVFCGEPQQWLPTQFRNTIVARQTSPPICVKMTPFANVVHTPKQIVAEFTRIYWWFAQFTGWEADRSVVTVHIYEDPNVGAHENGLGIHFPDHNFNWDVGNWCHEMTHVCENGQTPDWFGHALVRTVDAFDSIDTLYPNRPGVLPEQRVQKEREMQALAKKVLDDPNYRTADLQELFFALRARFGTRATSGFYHAMKEAGDGGEIELRRGWHFTKEHVVTFMSRAIGQDARPYFEKWTGWKDVSP
jgi:hypothetical protein